MNYVPAVPDASSDIASCQKLFDDFARQTANGTPLYSRLAAGIASDETLAGLLLRAPPAQRLPVLLFACVHWLVLGEPDTPLGRITAVAAAVHDDAQRIGVHRPRDDAAPQGRAVRQ